MRELDNAYYGKKSAKYWEVRKSEATHPLLETGSRKPRKGRVGICLNCKNEFYAGPCQNWKICCSKKCSFEYVSRNKQRRICLVCYTQFACSDSQVIYRGRKTCSTKCRSIMIQEIASIKREINPISVKSVARSLRYSKAMEDWRVSVFKRDNYTCQHCGARSKKGIVGGVCLQAHHIKQFAEFPKLRFDINNGLTLCKPCHKAVHAKN